jgi:hypothetical protein
VADLNHQVRAGLDGFITREEVSALAAISLGLRRALRFGLRITDGLGQHFAKLGLGFRGFPRRFLPLGHDLYVGMTEGELNPR